MLFERGLESEAMEIIDLASSGDARGMSFGVTADVLAMIGPARDIHVAEVRPGAVRGNHCHMLRGELIAVAAKGAWSLHWDTGEGSDVEVRSFEGPSGTLVVPPIGWSHAVRNDGTESLWIVATSDRPNEVGDGPDRPVDTVRRVVVNP